MTALSRIGKITIYSALLNCALFLVLLVFLLSTRWDDMLDQNKLTGPFLTISVISDKYLTALLIRLFVGTLLFGVMLLGFVGKHNSNLLGLCILFVSCVGIGALFLVLFETEFHNGDVFRRPSGTGLLYPPAIYTSLIIVVGIFVALMWVALKTIKSVIWVTRAALKLYRGD